MHPVYRIGGPVDQGCFPAPFNHNCNLGEILPTVWKSSIYDSGVTALHHRKGCLAIEPFVSGQAGRILATLAATRFQRIFA
jgi:hypothetical protein